DAAAFLDELVRTRNSLGLRRVPVPVPTPAPPPAEPEPPASGRHRAKHSAEDSTVLGAPPEGTDDRTEKVDPGALATQHVSGPGTRADDPLGSTVRTPPVRPGPIGPQGTRALSRGDYPRPAGAVDTAQPYPQPRPQPRVEPARPARTPYEQQRHRARRTMLIWVAIVLVLAAVLGAVAWWFGSGRWTAVPKISGLNPTAAERTLQDADLSGAITQEHSDTVPAGQVVSTSPVIGARALRGSTITVVISEGKPIVPDVTPGASPDAVEQAVKQAQLDPRLDPSQDSYSGSVPKGQVVALNPGPGTQLKLGSPVVVVLSKGPPPNPVPNVVGQPRDQAFAALSQAGFSPFDEPQAFDPNTPGGAVIKTDPAAGAVAPDGNKVGVVTSNAVAVPNLQGQPGSQAQQALQQMGLQAQIQAAAGDPNGQVFVESPAPGTLVAPGSTVTLGVFP
ncbi:MAG TPA: PASTA domain-containing protein, partial [Pseudonocardiaceae bacterium]|nr:PASTA domain-containing protein [Pseudonocardiaceae bacterium]